MDRQPGKAHRPKQLGAAFLAAEERQQAFADEPRARRALAEGGKDDQGGTRCLAARARFEAGERDAQSPAGYRKSAPQGSRGVAELSSVPRIVPDHSRRLDRRVEKPPRRLPQTARLLS